MAHAVVCGIPYSFIVAEPLATSAAIFLTHDHDDHVDPRTLFHLPRTFPFSFQAGRIVVSCIMIIFLFFANLGLPMCQRWLMEIHGNLRVEKLFRCRFMGKILVT